MFLLLNLLLNQLCIARQHAPSCSQVRLFEKTVCYEHNVDGFDEKFKEWETRISNDLNDLKAIKHELGQKLGDIDIALEGKKTELDVALTESLKKQELALDVALAEGLKKQELALDVALAEGLKKHELALNTIKDKALTPTIVFLVNGVSEQDVDVGIIIKFTSVVTNEGGAYNIGTGKFTAPYNGAYIFTTSVCAWNRKSLIVKLMAADRELGSTGIYTTVAFGTCSGIHGMTVLSKGDKVWVQGASKSTKALYSGDRPICPTVPTFSGMLVHTETA